MENLKKKQVERKNYVILVGVVLGLIILMFALGYTKDMVKYIFLCFFLSILFIVLKIKHTIPIQEVVVPFIILVGLFYCFFISPFAISDEAGHFYSEYALANKIVGKECVDGNGNYLDIKGITTVETVVRDVDIVLFNQEKFDFKYNDLFEKSNEYIWMEFPVYQYAVVPGYIFGAIAIIIGRVLSLSAYGLVLAVRVSNLIVYAICAYWSLKLIPIGKELMLSCFTLPIAIQQGMSCSYDSLFYAFTFLYISYVIYLTYEKEAICLRKLLILGVLSVIVAPMKGAYVMIILCALLILMNANKNHKSNGKIIFAIIGISFVTWLVYSFAAYNVMDIIDPDIQERYVSYSNQEGVYVSTFLLHPIKLIAFVFNGIAYKGMSLFQLTQEQRYYYPGEAVSILFGILLLYSCIRNQSEEALNVKQRQAISLIVLLTYTMIALLTNISFGGESVLIPQISTRYILPIVPLLGLVLKSDRIVIKADSPTCCRHILQMESLIYIYIIIVSILQPW